MPNYVTQGITPPVLTSGGVEQALADLRERVVAAGAVRRATLVEGPEIGTAITMTGQIRDLLGAPVTGVHQVMIRTLAPTADEGDIAVSVGTIVKIFLPLTGEKVAAILTTAAGAFTFRVFDAVAESLLVQVSVANGLTTFATLTFAGA